MRDVKDALDILTLEYAVKIIKERNGGAKPQPGDGIKANMPAMTVDFIESEIERIKNPSS